MEYTIQKLSHLAGISTRALRFYDEIGILSPARINSSGYRIYAAPQVERLQRIMFYRELGVSLSRIKELLSAPESEQRLGLCEHRAELLAQRERLDRLIATLDKTIATNEGRMTMSDKERFEAFKRKMVADNEEKYGVEVRERYGEETVAASNRKLMNLTEEEYAEVERLSAAILETLAEAMDSGDPDCEKAQQAVELHRRWLSFFWVDYSKEAHAGLGRMYVDDPRFAAYYEAKRPGMATFLRDAILVYAGENE